MLRIYACISSEHDFRLVLLSGLIGLIASITAFTLADHIRATQSSRNSLWMWALAFVSGAGIWSTHFIAMLAFRPQVPLGYSPLLTTVSIVAAIAIVGIGWRVALSSLPWAAQLAGLIMASGIAAMHYLGMAALEAIGQTSYDIPTALETGICATGLTIAAQLNFRKSNSRLPLIPGALFALAICTMHFGAMAAVVMLPRLGNIRPDHAIDANSLSVLITLVVLSLLGIAFATAVFQRRLIIDIKDEVQRLKAFADGAVKGLAIVEGGIIIDANDRFWSITGFDPKAPPLDLHIGAVLPDYVSPGFGTCQVGFGPMILINADGVSVDVEVRGQHSAIRGTRHELVVVRNISPDRKAAARLAHLMTHDALTGAATRAAFAQTLEDILARENSAALLCLDLDRFQVINELYGHGVGDAVLVEVAKRIRECLGDGEDLARLGGDEFAVIQRNGDQPGRAAHLARRILTSLSADMAPCGIVLTIGASIGIALHATDAKQADDLHKKAHLALQRAKSQGRGQFCFFDAAIDQQLLQRYQLEADLRCALAMDQFHIHYQPIMSLATGQATGFEALLRWNHPDRGSISPAIFIPIAEEIGMIGAIGEWVLLEACGEAANWPNPLKISINVSAAQFSHGDLEAAVGSILDKTGLDPRRLDIEVTEGLVMKEADNALAILHRLKLLGISISMDDFGTGYSSLSYFRLFPFDKVKIDQSFVRDMGSNPQAANLVNAIIGIGKSLGLSVIAEGVETAEQLGLLRDLGCDQVQGYLIARPAPIAEFGNLLQRRGVAQNMASVLDSAANANWHQSAQNKLSARMAKAVGATRHPR